MISFIVCLNWPKAAAAADEEHIPAADRETTLFDVDAGAGHTMDVVMADMKVMVKMDITDMVVVTDVAIMVENMFLFL